jgi:hypothetical protein
MSANGEYKDLWQLLKRTKNTGTKLKITPTNHTRKTMMRALSKEKDEDPDKDYTLRIKCTDERNEDGLLTGAYILELVETKEKTRATTINKVLGPNVEILKLEDVSADMKLL